MIKYLNMFSLYTKVTNLLIGTGIGKLPGITFAYKSIYEAIRPKGIKLVKCESGDKMFVNADDIVVSNSLLLNGIWEKAETELFKSLLKPGFVVFDLGANIGYYSLIAAKSIGNNGKVYAFEPEPNNCDLLLRNVKINKYTNINLIKKAVSNKVGTAQLFIDKRNLAAHSLSEGNIEYATNTFYEVETITLDKFVKDEVTNQKVDIIKMDVEGAEGLAIAGAEQTLLRNHDVIILMEFRIDKLTNMGTDPSELLERIRRLGFTIRLIEDSLTEYPNNRELLTKVRFENSVNLLLQR